MDSELKLLLRDVIAEYINRRTPIIDYVSKRYAGDYPADFKERKALTIEKKIETLRNFYMNEL